MAVVKEPPREAQNKEWWKMRNQLKQAIADKNDNLVLRLHDQAMARFEEIGYPDYWQDWERAKSDIEMKRVHTRGLW